MHELDTEELANYAVFGGYLALVAVSFIGCFVSIMASGAGKDTVLSGRPFVFIRAAFGAFFCTWYCAQRVFTTNSSHDSVLEGGEGQPQQLTAVVVLCVRSPDTKPHSWTLAGQHAAVRASVACSVLG